MFALLRTFSWQELRHHPWRNASAVLAVMLGVSLAFSVQLINASALSEFSSAVRSAGGQPDLELRSSQGGFEEQLFERVAQHPAVALASPVVELQTLALAPSGERQPLHVVGIDALAVAKVAPGLMPMPARGADRMAVLSSDTVFLNAAAQRLFPGATLQVQIGLQLHALRVAGTVGAAGAPLAVMDIGAAQERFAQLGKLSRIDVRLREGVRPDEFIRSLALPPGVLAAEPSDAAQRVNRVSRAYRVNLTVLALVALFTGAFLVFSVLALSVARRAQQLALLGVLGLTARQRMRLVLTESILLGLTGSIAGIALGTALAAMALRLLGGDLGGGYFPGVAPQLHWSTPAAIIYAAMGVAAAAAGGWLPARLARRLPLAQTLKGLGVAWHGRRHGWLSVFLLASGVAFALVPPIAGLPIAAYLSVALLLVGGITALPPLVALVYDQLAPHVAHHVLPLLAVERARRVRESAAVAVSGVVAALGLAVALTVMVASFRESMMQWLDVVLPADLYLRTASYASGGDGVFLPPEFVAAVAQVPGVQRTSAQRLHPLLLDASRPSVMLLARPIDDPARSLPLVAGPVAVDKGQISIYVSEAMVDLYGARLGASFAPLSTALAPGRYVVAGVWRDYVRQYGAVMLAQRDYQRLTGDFNANELQLWLARDADEGAVQQRVRDLVQREGGGSDFIEFASAAQLRATSLRLFDRSFAVTYWLQAVAIAIGLFGVAASFSAQVLARRKEFGLLAHLGLTRRQILTVVAGEGAAWTLIGALAGLVLGLAVAVVLVEVVNPQSFHWTMDMRVPLLRLFALCLAVIAAGTLTAWMSRRAAAGRDAVLAVKEDW